MPKLIAEVKAMQGFEDVSKRQIEAKIKTIAVKEKRGTDAVSFNSPSLYLQLC